jgi:hypothetical protein
MQSARNKLAEALLSDADPQDCADVESLKAMRLLFIATDPIPRLARRPRLPLPPSVATCVVNAERGTAGEGNLTIGPCDREFV